MAVCEPIARLIFPLHHLTLQRFQPHQAIDSWCYGPTGILDKNAACF